ncbi:MAG: hypothetical protein BGO40_06290 [Chryseobacterium sp. 39-10]|nr:DUF4199 domain-containing protein [Chryseobacterium sp.]OJV49849.1 MAG: hypothetical protein BGO40_06290 [Chryseobacterium sp. 39-10]
MVKNVYVIGLWLFAATMLVFFALYFFGMNVDYFQNTLLLNAFVLPAVYVVGGYVSVNSVRKAGIAMGFRHGFKRAFQPMFIGGLLSVFAIYFFLNVADKDAKDLLNYQYIERQKTELNNEYEKAKLHVTTEEEKVKLDTDYHHRLQSFSPEMIKGKDMFTLRQFVYYFAAILVFYVILSIFFASFFRSRREL